MEGTFGTPCIYEEQIKCASRIKDVCFHALLLKLSFSENNISIYQTLSLATVKKERKG
jgi:hypothetical protein